ncbi:hypothetical protein LNTAR_05739 [Lentisphaera araneosa HTCC2155]|uniref:Uncharacterized protein n=1 Tax=Lentisphaera araneosa HTCC2155 TaxID=313628 RepID=A6DPF6_9BACT|nr:MFS transporter [Lentisphaera araneosa]EDM26452.1 hypothetical protein LNTAR_05739 [Lentisphaera araneosa HTCC2155]
MHDNLPIPEKDRVPASQKLAYGAGGLGDFFIPNFIQALFTYVFIVDMKLDPVKMGWVLAATKAVSMIGDPTAGVISDKTRTKWGRRKPFILITGILCAIMMPFVWMVPSVEGGVNLYFFHISSENFKFVFIFFMMSAYFLAHSFYSVPYKALGFELTKNYDEKTKVFTWKKYVETLGLFMVAWFYWFAARPIFGGVSNGAVVLGIIVGAILIICSVTVFFGNHEVAEEPSFNKKDKIPLGEAIKATFTNKSFLLIQGAILFVMLGMGVDAIIGNYLHVHYTSGGSEDVASKIGGVGGTVSTIVIFVALPIALWVSTHWGKKEAALMGTFVLLAGVCSIPWMMTPSYPYLIVVVWALSQFGAQTTNLVYTSMMADVCDEDELITGQRREGTYAAASSIIAKVSDVFVLLLSGYMPRLAGYVNTEVKPNMEQLENMKTLLVASDIIGVIAAIILIVFYPLSRKKCQQIQEQLEARNAANEAEVS